MYPLNLMQDFLLLKGLINKFLLRSAFPLKLNENFWHVRQKVNINNMKKASKFLIGKHDFTSFRSILPALTPVKTIDKIDFDMESKKYINLKDRSKKFFT